MNARLRRRFLFALIGFGAVMTLVSDRAGGIMSMMLGLLLLGLALDIWLARKQPDSQAGKSEDAARQSPGQPPEGPTAG